MSTISRNTSETSVSFSLAELARIEEERVREEDSQRKRAREKDAREQREAEARRLAAEAARIAADEDARARRRREEVEQQTRLEARERAAADVARIEAEARARLSADNAQRAHELALLRARTEAGGSRVQRALGAALAVLICAGGVAGFGVSRHVTGLEQETAQVRDQLQALAKERESAKTTELSALDQRFAALRARRLIKGAEEGLRAVEAARGAIDAKALDHDRLRAFGDALDALDRRLDTLDHLAALDARRADLAAWAGDHKRPELGEAEAAAVRARAAGAGDSMIGAYERSLDRLRDALEKTASGPGQRQQRTGEGQKDPGWKCTDPNDPMCGLNGRPL